MSQAQEVRVATDLPENTATVTVTHTVEYTLDELFNSVGELRLWEDACGWNGLLRENGTFFEVNKIHDEESWVRKQPVSQDYVLKAIASHIRDPQAGATGKFVRRCSPP